MLVAARALEASVVGNIPSFLFRSSGSFCGPRFGYHRVGLSYHIFYTNSLFFLSHKYIYSLPHYVIYYLRHLRDRKSADRLGANLIIGDDNKQGLSGIALTQLIEERR